jgi:hypothetical protein
MFLQSLFTQNSLLSPCSYVLQFSGFNACSSDPVNIYSLLSAPTSRQTSISIVHFVRILVCAKTRKEKANTTRDATVRKDGLDTTAKSQRMRLLNSKSEGIIILLSWCLLFFSSLVWPELWVSVSSMDSITVKEVLGEEDAAEDIQRSKTSTSDRSSSPGPRWKITTTTNLSRDRATDFRHVET